jgi:hypothetical protein
MFHCTVIILVCFYSGLNSDFLLYENDNRRSTNGTTQEGMPDMAKMMKIMIYVSPLMMLFFFNSYAWIEFVLFISNTITIELCLSLKLYYRQ